MREYFMRQLCNNMILNDIYRICGGAVRQTSPSIRSLTVTPFPITGLHTYCAVLFFLVCQHRTKSILPKPNFLVANVYPGHVQEVFHISELTWDPDKHHYRKADNFRAYLKVMKGAALCHRQTLKRGPFSLKFV